MAVELSKIYLHVRTHSQPRIPVGDVSHDIDEDSTLRGHYKCDPRMKRLVEILLTVVSSVVLARIVSLSPPVTGGVDRENPRSVRPGGQAACPASPAST